MRVRGRERMESMFAASPLGSQMGPCRQAATQVFPTLTTLTGGRCKRGNEPLVLRKVRRFVSPSRHNRRLHLRPRSADRRETRLAEDQRGSGMMDGKATNAENGAITAMPARCC